MIRVRRVFLPVHACLSGRGAIVRGIVHNLEAPPPSARSRRQTVTELQPSDSSCGQSAGFLDSVSILQDELPCESLSENGENAGLPIQLPAAVAA
jgi:hypothetical protein